MSRKNKNKQAQPLPTMTIALEVPISLVKPAQDILDARGSSLDAFVASRLLAFTRQTTILGLGDRMTFGKYTGMFVEACIRADLEYMYWIMTKSNCKDRFDEDVKGLVRQLAREDGHVTTDMPF